MELIVREYQNPCRGPHEFDRSRGKGHGGSAQSAGEAESVRVSLAVLFMSATSFQSPSSPIDEAGAPAASPAEIDASCRLPVLYLIWKAVWWLAISSIFSLIASLKFHSPNILADCAWLTYGRVQPAQVNMFIYGFAMPAGMGSRFG